MTDKPVLSVEEKEKFCAFCYEECMNKDNCIFENISKDLIRAHVVKALDGIELPEHEMELMSVYKIKQAIQKAKEAYL